MKTTRDDIINISLKLFAERGFDAVSTSMIAEQLGITKGALYRHFENKQGIFDAIFDKMVELDAERANEDCVPEKKYEDDAESYKNTQFEDLCEFTCNQFVFWTENEFARNFRRMVTLEQFKSPERMKLFKDVICAGPVEYTKDLMNEMIKAGKLNAAAAEFGAENLAIQLFAPLSLTLQMSDGGMDSSILKKYLREITGEFKKRWEIQEK